MKIGFALPIIGVIVLAGSIFLITKWPLIISLFFATIKIYTAFSVFLNQFFS
jgi:hypothetical protein